jgi:uncharacterized protein YkwD
MAPVALLLLHLLCAPACAEPRGAGALPMSDASFAAERRLCLEITNRYRATVKAPPLSVSPALEAYAADAARHDGLAHAPHAYFERTNGGNVALAENLVPWWSLARRRTAAAIVEDGLALMWAEGPKGVHRRNMAGRYTEVGCGLFVNGDEVTMVQAFR